MGRFGDEYYRSRRRWDKRLSIKEEGWGKQEQNMTAFWLEKTADNTLHTRARAHAYTEYIYIYICVIIGLIYIIIR